MRQSSNQAVGYAVGLTVVQVINQSQNESVRHSQNQSGSQSSTSQSGLVCQLSSYTVSQALIEPVSHINGKSGINLVMQSVSQAVSERISQ